MYPEHEKLKLIQDKSQAQGDFLEWLGERGYTLCQLNGEDYYPIYTSTQKLLEEFHGIDGRKLEDEKRAMLKECRNV